MKVRSIKLLAMMSEWNFQVQRLHISGFQFLWGGVGVGRKGSGLEMLPSCSASVASGWPMFDAGCLKTSLCSEQITI